MDNQEEKVVVKYSSYTPAQKKATQKYRENNKEKVNEQRKKYYQERKDKDPNFLVYKREKAREYYRRRKLREAVVPETAEEVKEEEVPVVEEPVVEESIIYVPPPSKPKRTRMKTIKKVETIEEVGDKEFEKTFKDISEVMIEEAEQLLEPVPAKKPRRKKQSKEV